MAAQDAASASPAGGRRLRALVVAELANPNWISVPLVGWSHWRALSQVADTHLVTHARNRENILAAGIPAHQFTALETRPVERFTDGALKLLRAGYVGTMATALGALSYYYFEHLLWKTFGRRIRAGEFDVVHRLTPLSPTVSSTLAAKCARAGVPFVLGPLNGGLPWPEEFDHVRRQQREWLTYVRDAYKLFPAYRSTREHAAAIICGSRATRAEFSPRYDQKTVYYPENAIDPSLFDGQSRERSAAIPLRIAFVGRLIPLKGCDMLIEAVAPLVRAGRVTLDIIGDGPQMGELRALAEREGIGADSFAGWVQHSELQQRLGRADVFAFPSIHDFGGAVVLEAMALGLVPIVMAYGGPGELVSESTGFALPMGTRDDIVRRLRETITRLADDPSGIQAMGQRARRRVLHSFTWPAKARQTLEVYRWVTGQRSRPDFGMPLADPD